MSEREWYFYLDDMIQFSEQVLSYTEGLDQKGFEKDEKTYDAVLRKLELIPEAIRETSSTIPWRQIVATRNRLIHGYLGIDNDILWSIVRDDVPVLLINLKRLKK